MLYFFVEHDEDLLSEHGSGRCWMNCVRSSDISKALTFYDGVNYGQFSCLDSTAIKNQRLFVN